MRVTCFAVPIRVGHSADPDDAFMVWALEAGRVDTRGLELEPVSSEGWESTAALREEVRSRISDEVHRLRAAAGGGKRSAPG